MSEPPPALRVDTTITTQEEARRWISAIGRWFEVENDKPAPVVWPEVPLEQRPGHYTAVRPITADHSMIVDAPVRTPRVINMAGEGGSTPVDPAAGPPQAAVANPTPGSVGPEAQAAPEIPEFPKGPIPVTRRRTSPEATADWPELVARVEAGEKIRDVAKAAGVRGTVLAGKVTAAKAKARAKAAAEASARARRERRESAVAPSVPAAPAPAVVSEDAAGALALEPDWDAMVAEVLAGAPSREVAARAGVDTRRLTGKVSYFKARREREAALSPDPAPLQDAQNVQIGQNVKSEQSGPEPASAKPAENIPDPIPEPQPEPATDFEDESGWTVDRDIELLCGLQGGFTPDEIADEAGWDREMVERRLDAICPEPRSATTVGAALRRIRDQAQAARARECMAKAPAPKTPPKPNGMSTWTVHRDLELVEGFVRIGIGRTIERMGISEAEAKARWNHLLPVKGLDQQARLLKRLREEVAHAVG